ncbi:MAG: DUF2071 domain-containing protein [Halobacteriales archaeon]|nr:DUF2071 domain-containing protein [Halobacteriales archaeon]
MSPAVRGFVESRLLVNYRVDVETLESFLPEPFRAREVGETGVGVGTVCFTSVEEARPRVLPESVGVSFRTVTHRVHVEIDDGRGVTFCVYVPRRDVSSRFCALAGSLLLPAEFEKAEFRTEEKDGARLITVNGDDVFAGVEAYETDRDDVREGSVFYSLESASRFLCEGGVEFTPSVGRKGGVEFHADGYEIKPVEVADVRSSYFGRMGGEFDSAFVMEDIENEWVPRRPRG